MFETLLLIYSEIILQYSFAVLKHMRRKMMFEEKMQSKGFREKAKWWWKLGTNGPGSPEGNSIKTFQKAGLDSEK